MFLNRNAAHLIPAIRARLPETLPGRMGIAVSGGGDSVALMYLLHDIARTEGVTLRIATVDHGLRPEAAREAEMVGAHATQLGLGHDILRWIGWNGSGNLQDQARNARYGLLTDWARSNGIPAICLGHTADDQAETVLMRLGRSAGVTGLSAMSPSRMRNQILILRPMLGVGRQSLRDYLSEIGADWVEDPSNQDNRYDRIKARAALAHLEPLGISADSLSRVAENLAQAREALAQYAQDSARKVAHVADGDVCVDLDGVAGLPDEIRRRLLVGIIAWLSGPGYPPRQSAINQVVTALFNAKSTSIGGCLVLPDGDKAWICREFNAVAQIRAATGACWDRRWILSGPGAGTAEVRALGERGLLSLPDWRVSGRPRLALQASPAVWKGDDLLAAPLAGYPNGWRAELAPDWPEFYASFLSH